MPDILNPVAATITLQSYITDAQRLLHDSTYRFWSQQELTDYINKARKMIAAESLCTRLLHPIDIAAAEDLSGATYNMDSMIDGRRVNEVLDILLMYSSNTQYPLRYLPFERIVRTGLWQTQYPGTPSHYTVHNRNVYLLQWPGIAYPGSSFDCAVEPLPLTALDDPDYEIPFPFTECVGFYTAHLAKIKDQRRPEAEEFMVDYQRRMFHAIGTLYTRRLVNR